MVDDRLKRVDGLQKLLMSAEPVRELVFKFLDSQSLITLCKVSSWLRARAKAELACRGFQPAIQLPTVVNAWAESKPELKMKVVLICGCASGKTTMFIRLRDDRYLDDSPSTVAAGYGQWTREIAGLKKPVRLEMWDTAGQERYMQMLPMYIKGASVIVVFIDVTDKGSLHQAEDWVSKLIGQHDCGPYLLCLAKCDLPHDPKVVSGIMDLAGKYGLHYVKTSAKTGKGAKDLMKAIITLGLMHQFVREGHTLPVTPAAKQGCTVCQ